MMLEDKQTTFVFKCFEKESADLKIRLRYDNLTQTLFFRSLMKMYISKNPKMMDLVAEIKQDSHSMGKRKIYKSRKDLMAGEKLLSDLGLTEEERTNIFDIIESGEGEYD